MAVGLELGLRGAVDLLERGIDAETDCDGRPVGARVWVEVGAPDGPGTWLPEDPAMFAGPRDRSTRTGVL